MDDTDFCSLFVGKSFPQTVLEADDIIHLRSLATGCYSPLDRFMGPTDLELVLSVRRLLSGEDWRLPILLHISPSEAEHLRDCETVLLGEKDGGVVGAVQGATCFPVDLAALAERVYGSKSTDHPGVARLMARPAFCLAGQVSVRRCWAEAPSLFWRPTAVRKQIADMGLGTIAAFSTRNICHIGHEHLHRIALELTGALSINLMAGSQMAGSFRFDTAMEAYARQIAGYYPEKRVILSSLWMPPIAAGPSEAMLQAVVMQNCGYSHYIVGRDHAGVGDYYGRYASQDCCASSESLGLEILPISAPRYCKVCGGVQTERSCAHDQTQLRNLDGRTIRRQLVEGDREGVAWAIRAEVLEYLLAELDAGRPIFND